jgi:hypothetical protein
VVMEKAVGGTEAVGAAIETAVVVETGMAEAVAVKSPAVVEVTKEITQGHLSPNNLFAVNSLHFFSYQRGPLCIHFARRVKVVICNVRWISCCFL